MTRIRAEVCLSRQPASASHAYGRCIHLLDRIHLLEWRGGDRTRAHAWIKVVAAVLPLGLIAGCSATGGGAHADQPAARQKAVRGQLAGPAVPLDITGRIEAKLVGHPPVAWTLTNVAMATDKIGWAAGKGSIAVAQPVLALGTTDGGRSFSLLFMASAPIVAVSVPDAGHAFFLEQSCENGGLCTTILQAWRVGARRPVTLWQRQGEAAIGLSFPTAEDGYVATAALAVPSKGMNLYTTHDGGRQFHVSSLPCPSSSWNPDGPGALAFRSSTAGWLLCGGPIGGGPHGTNPWRFQVKTVYATTDAGAHWSLVAQTPHGARSGSLPRGGIADALSLTSGQVAYIGLDGAGFFATEDAGRTWHRVFAAAGHGGGWAYSVGLLSDGFGYLLAGSPSRFLATTDRGHTWQALSQTPPPVPDSLAWDLGQGLAVASARPAVYRWSYGNPDLLVSSDGGGHWATFAHLPNWAWTLQALSAQYLVAGDNRSKAGAVAESRDLGRHWSRIRLPRDWQVWSLGYHEPDQGWVTADYQSTEFGIFACSRTHCTELSAPFSPLLAQQTGSRSGFAVGKDTQGRWALFTTRSEGRHWSERLLGQTYNMSGIGAKGRLEWLYQIDDYPAAMEPPHPMYPGTVVLRSTDAGRTWQEIDLPPGLQAVQSLSFSDPSNGLLVTSSPVTGVSCWQTSDGGATFHLMP